MTALTRSVHASKIVVSDGPAHSLASVPMRESQLGAVRDSSHVTGVVVDIMGAHAVAVELECTGSGEFREEIVLHGEAGWGNQLSVGERVHVTGEWELADWHLWPAHERSRYLAIRGRLEFCAHSVRTTRLKHAAA